MKKVVSKNPLYFAFLFPAVVDGFLTLIGQGQDYWEKGIVNEASPAYYFLKLSPPTFIAGTVVWFVCWYLIFNKLKEPINVFLTILFISGHSWGSTSWIWKIARENGFYVLDNQLSIITVWLLVVFYFSLISIFATHCIKFYFSRK